MIRLIADSGSTKTDWLLTRETGEDLIFQTKGINPFFRTSEDIYHELEEELLPQIEKVDQIFFYGAGIINEECGDVVKKALSRLFPGVLVDTRSDVLGASRALFEGKAGIACILGTGSNACFFDGNEVITGVPPLGFILGDECSGAVLGRKLLGDFFKNIMPPDIQTLFEKEYALTKTQVLQQVYCVERPNKYLAGFTPFLSKYIEKDYCVKLVSDSAKEFFERNILRIPNALSFPIGFVGSVAWNFRSIIDKIAAEYKFNKPLIIKGPIEKLREYHERV